MTAKSQKWAYSNIVKDHFFNPKNLLQDKEKFISNGQGEVGSSICGDVMKIWIKVKNNKIIACRWKTFGCASAVASTSMLSVMITEKGGMSLEKARKITPRDIVKRLKGLPKNKIHCSVLSDQALRKAIDNYLEKKSQN